MKKESIYIVMPAYNEEANIRAVVETWYQIPEGGIGGLSFSYCRQWKY